MEGQCELQFQKRMKEKESILNGPLHIRRNRLEVQRDLEEFTRLVFGVCLETYHGSSGLRSIRRL